MRGNLEKLIEEHLGLEEVKAFGRSRGGCISAGRGYETSSGPIFVKTNEKSGAEKMFRGELVSLREIVAIEAIGCPKPIGVFPIGSGGWALALEYEEFNGSHRNEKEFARCLAGMHLNNAKRLAQAEADSSFVGASSEEEESSSDRCPSTNRFGFPVETCCGYLPQPNDWTDSWADFFIRNRLQIQVDRLIEKGDRDLREMWPFLQLKAAELLESCHDHPALVHGDLWNGNWDFTSNGPVIFDPSSCFADSEYEQGIMNMFGGVGHRFWDEYHRYIPKRQGRERRVLLYELYHNLNHWNHFGGGYRGSSLALIRQILG